MATTLICPACSASMVVPAHRPGMQVRCPGCRQVVVPAGPRPQEVLSLDDAEPILPVRQQSPMPLPIEDDLPPEPRSNMPLILAVALVAVLAAGAVGYWLATRDKPAEETETTSSTTTTTTTTTTPPKTTPSPSGALPADESKDLAALDTLIQVVRTGEPADRLAAARRLGALGTGGVSAIPALLAAADGKSAVLDAAVGTALGKIGPPRSGVDAIVRAVGAKSAVARGYAVQTLADSGSVPAEAVASLVAALTDTSAKIRAGAAKALGVAGPMAKSAALAPLLELAADADDTVRTAVGAALAKLGPFEADDRAALEAKLTHAEPKVRVAAAGLLAPLVTTADDALKTWQPRLKDSDPDVQAFVLGQFVKQPEALEKCGDAVVMLLNDPTPAARLAAVTVAPKLKGVSGLEPAIEKLLATEPDAAVKSAGMVAAVALADADAKRVGLFRKALTDGPPPARRAAADKLAELKTDAASAVDDLIQCVTDADDESRAAAIRALVAVGPDGVRGRDAVAKTFAGPKTAEAVLIAAADYLAAVEGGAKALKEARTRPMPAPVAAAMCRAFAKAPDAETLKWMIAQATDVEGCREVVAAALVKRGEDEHVRDLIELTYAIKARKPGQPEQKATVESRRWALATITKMKYADCTAATKLKLADRVKALSMAVGANEKELAAEAAAFLKQLR